MILVCILSFANLVLFICNVWFIIVTAVPCMVIIVESEDLAPSAKKVCLENKEASNSLLQNVQQELAVVRKGTGSLIRFIIR